MIIRHFKNLLAHQRWRYFQRVVRFILVTKKCWTNKQVMFTVAGKRIKNSCGGRDQVSLF